MSPDTRDRVEAITLDLFQDELVHVLRKLQLLLERSSEGTGGSEAEG